MSQGEGGGRPRKHPREPAIGQYAIDAEWQEIADGNTDAIVERNKWRGATYLVDTAGEKNNRFAAIIMAINEISKDADLNDINTLYACLDRYIKWCFDHNVTITNSGAYAACGVSKQAISDWACGVKRVDQPEYKEFAALIRQLCGINREQMMADGKLNPIVGIWWQKNFDGYTDKPRELIEVSEDERDPTVNEIAQKYANIGDD